MRKKIALSVLGLMIASTLLAGCADQTNKEEEIMQETSNTIESSSVAPESTTETISDPIAEAIAQENSVVDTSAPETSADEDRVPTAEISELIPSKYISLRVKEAGTIQHISYPSHDYFGDGSEITKEANVYLPYNYDENTKYNVLYLMHGIGGDEAEWGMTNNMSRVKIIMDNLIYYGDVEPFIVVTPNGRSATNHAKEGSDYMSFYCFGQELRNDLIPYMESNFSIFSSDDPADSRDHRAMAGLSMGGMQTINIGIGECIDLFSYFGAFSAAPTSNPASKTAEILKGNTLPIHYFYNLCGTEDNIAYASASAAAKNLPDVCDQFVDGENFMWQEKKGIHDFNIWYLGFYNFAQLVFQAEE